MKTTKKSKWAAPPKTNPLEKVIEKKVCDHAKSLGCLTYKFTSPNRRSVPDRCIIMPEGKGVFFIEFKRRGEKPTAAQAIEIEKIRDKGTYVGVIDDIQKGKNYVEEMLYPLMEICIKNGDTHTARVISIDDPFFS